MDFNKNFDFFEFTEKILERFRSETGFDLSGYEFQYNVKRDWNCPVERLNINLMIFGEDYAHTAFDENHNTVDKVIDLLFVHLRDDAGFDDLKYGMISALTNRMENYLESLFNEIELISRKKLEEKGFEKLICHIDEKYPVEFYENGFPVMQLKILSTKDDINLTFDLDFNMRGFDEKEVIKVLIARIKELK